MSDTSYILTFISNAGDFLMKNAIALCALFIAIQQGMASRRHNRLSILPALDSHTDRNINGSQVELIFSLRNAGLGPAVISSYEVLRNGNACTYNNELISELLKTHGKVDFCKTSTFCAGKIIQAGEEHVLCRVTVSPIDGGLKKDALLEQVESTLEKALNLVVKYKSFYGQRMPTLDTRKKDVKESA